jgi:hypothetical protein
MHQLQDQDPALTLVPCWGCCVFVCRPNIWIFCFFEPIMPVLAFGALQGFLEGLVCFMVFLVQVVIWPVLEFAGFPPLSVCFLPEFFQLHSPPFLGLMPISAVGTLELITLWIAFISLLHVLSTLVVDMGGGSEG